MPILGAPASRMFTLSSGKHNKNGYNSGTDSHLIPSAYVEVGTNPVRYWNSTTFQIISAGKDGLFWAWRASVPLGDRHIDRRQGAGGRSNKLL